MSEEIGEETSAPRQRGIGSFVIDTRPLRIPAFRRLWVSTAVTAVGSQFSAVACRSRSTT